MNYKALAAGALAGFLFAVVPSCGTPAATCGPANCATGCCDSSNKCVNPTTNAACGAVGQTCVACGNNESCVDGKCKVGTTGNDGGGTTTDGGGCLPDDCRCNGLCTTGCCDMTNGNCLLGRAQAACGINGAACKSCTPNACLAVGSTGGQCAVPDAGTTDSGIPPGPNDAGRFVTGNACTGPADCSINGSDTTCRTMTAQLNGTYPGGYCTKSCSQQSLCADDAVCVTFGGATSAEPNSLCAATCPTPGMVPGGCRTGYACYPLRIEDGGFAPRGVCWLYPPPSPDAGPYIPGTVGKACTMDSQCGPPPVNAYCELGTLPDGGPTPWVGGECSAVGCTSNAACGDGVCIPFRVNNQDVGFCQRFCRNPGQGQGDELDGGCRNAFVCAPVLFSDGGLATAFCTPNCNNPGGGCGPGSTCQATGYCQ